MNSCRRDYIEIAVLNRPPETAVTRNVLCGLNAEMGPTLSFTGSLPAATPGQRIRLLFYPAFSRAKFAWTSTRQN
jgi:hypothetical protein